jgi:hypothetical protein
MLFTAVTTHSVHPAFEVDPDTNSLFQAVNQDSSGSIAMGYGLDNRRTGIRFPTGTRDLSILHSVHTGYGTHTVFYLM